MSQPPQPPPKWVTNSRGFRKTNPEYQEYLRQQEREKNKREFQKLGFQVETVSVGRTVGDKLAGKSNPVVSQMSSENQRQYRLAKLNQAAYEGRVSPEQYQKQYDSIMKRVEEVRQQEIARRQEISRVKATSAAAKEREARAVAASQGVAVGTITKEGSAKGSVNSGVANIPSVNAFVEAQKPEVRSAGGIKKEPETMPQRGDKYKVTTPDGKERVFSSKESADAFISRIEGNYTVTQTPQVQGPPRPDNVLLPAGSLQYLYGQQQTKIARPVQSDNFFEALGNNLYNSLRYSDLVDSGEVKEPQGPEVLNYYSSLGLRSIYNIPLSLMGDKTVRPSLGSTVFDTGIELALTGKTKEHDPVGSYVKKDPLGALIQLPAEAALWIAGEKVIKTGAKAVSRYSPLTYQSEKVLANDKVKTVYRGLAWKNKPVIGIQEGKPKLGFDYTKSPLERISSTNLGREGFEAALGTGIEKKIYYSEAALKSQVEKNLIPKIAKERARIWDEAVDEGVKISSKPGAFGDKPIDRLSSQQSDYLLNKVVKLQKEKKIESLHGSTALRPQLGSQIQKEAGSSVKLGDIDVHPTGSNIEQKAKLADKLILDVKKEFPVGKGQKLELLGYGGQPVHNRALQLSGQGLDEPKKIFEVVLRSTDESGYGITAGEKILGHNIPFKSVKATDFPVKIKTADYQLLTNVKQAVAFQKGTSTKFDIYPSSGRTKDIVRGYWNLKAKALFKGGEAGKALDTKAEKIRSLYPGIEFTDYVPEKVLLYSSKGESSGQSNILSKLGGSPRPGITKESKIEIDESLNLKSPESILGSKTPSKDPYISTKLASRHGSRLQSRYGSRLQSRYTPRSAVTASYTISKPKNKDFSSLIHSAQRSSLTSSRETRPSVKSSLTRKENSILRQITQPAKTPPSMSIHRPSLSAKPPTSPGKTTLKTPLISSTQDSILNYKRNRYPVLFVPDWKHRIDIPRKEPRKYNKDWLGNVPVDKIVGLHGKRSEATYDEKKISLFLKEDKKKTKKNYRKKMLDFRKSNKSKIGFW